MIQQYMRRVILEDLRNMGRRRWVVILSILVALAECKRFRYRKPVLKYPKDTLWWATDFFSTGCKTFIEKCPRTYMNQIICARSYDGNYKMFENYCFMQYENCNTWRNWRVFKRERAYCTSLYTCSLWANYTEKSYSALRVQCNNAFRAVLGLPRFCSASGMFAEARTDYFYATMRKRGMSLVRRVRASSNAVLAMIATRLDCSFLRHCCNRHVPVSMPKRKY